MFGWTKQKYQKKKHWSTLKLFIALLYSSNLKGEKVEFKQKYCFYNLKSLSWFYWVINQNAPKKFYLWKNCTYNSCIVVVQCWKSH